MHIVILGAGALGTVLGAHLARAGEDVTMIARGNRAAYLQEHGATKLACLWMLDHLGKTKGKT